MYNNITLLHIFLVVCKGVNQSNNSTLQSSYTIIQYINIIILFTFISFSSRFLLICILFQSVNYFLILFVKLFNFQIGSKERMIKNNPFLLIYSYILNKKQGTDFFSVFFFLEEFFICLGPP